VIAVAIAAALLARTSDVPEPKVHPTATRTAPSAWPSTAVALPIRPIGQPTRLLADSIGVDAKVVPVGTTAAGAQEVPGSIDETGWWRDGRQPGQSGNAVIVGHTASRADGVFDNLSKLARGDKITVRGKAGTLTYAVTSESEVRVENFGPESDKIYRKTGRSGLVLMTCGDWNGSRYESTVVVYAKAVSGS
jgi:LPXTG-site transpeptidase (sortase) family protein